MIQHLLLWLIIASWLYWLVAWLLVLLFFRSRPRLQGIFTPPVSILKPVRGLDAGAYDNFVSFCEQDYPEFELLFGVVDPDDPAVPVIERVRREFPGLAIRLVICLPCGPNQKAGILHCLAGHARHKILVASDSDMRVTPDYLRQVVAPLADPKVGLVTCPYRGELPSQDGAAVETSLSARLEALHMGVTFLPSVMVARQFLTMRFAMGATVGVRRSDLDRIGGFASVADYLADDYQVAIRIAGLGRRVHLARYVPISVLSPTTPFRDLWAREIRWARCNRVNRPAEYPALLLTFSTPLALLLLLVDGLGVGGWRILVASLVWRWVIAWLVTLSTRDRTAQGWLPWLPLRDLLSAAAWAAGGVGRRICWRGDAFVVTPDGRMEPAPVPSGYASRRL